MSETLTLKEVEGAIPFFKIHRDADITHDTLYKALLTIKEFYDITKNVCHSPGACGGDCFPCRACVEQAVAMKRFWRKFNGS